eukprot:6344385-Pyramimonas_sp.AAC.1
MPRTGSGQSEGTQPPEPHLAESRPHSHDSCLGIPSRPPRDTVFWISLQDKQMTMAASEPHRCHA